MPPDPGSPAHWLVHATSDLELAKAGRSPDVLLEALCFHAQQAAEKAVKAALVSRSISFPQTHNIRTLLDLLPGDISVPQTIQDAVFLTDYAVASRYPTEAEPVTEAEYDEAPQSASAVHQWARGLVNL